MRNLGIAIVAALGVFLYASPSNAQATRTWVSGVGDDANPCSRTAPCKTFAGAISKTATGGEISVLDPGGFGALTITKSITVNGDGTLAGILAAGVNGIIVSSAAPASSVVILRNLSINGATTGANGIRVLGSAQVTIDKCSIYGFTGSAVDIASGVATEVYITDSYITEVGNGVGMFTSGPSLFVSINNTTIANVLSTGVFANGGNVQAMVARSTIAGSGGPAVATLAGTPSIRVDASTIFANATGFNASSSGSNISISNNNIYNNTVGYTIGAGATITSTQDNRTGGNGAGAPNGLITKQ